ncbi:MAG TPA: hypothetical protein PLO37_15810 [Candidatus Hydrogenedentes bacterium]|nr:hypothetical protein [Candidatus Hydrogenedentota bacterium]HPG68313.1 hypothetical protein [Candidatus Hydrogenedentota bacterium]
MFICKNVRGFQSTTFTLILLTASISCFADSNLAAGTAKTVITPPDAKPRVSVMGVVPKSKEHDLYARALVLNDGTNRLVIITYDLNCLDVATPILRVRCRDELGIPPANLILLGSHNHQAPIQIVPDNFDYGRWLAEQIFRLIQEAIANEQGPVRLSFGSGQGDFVTAMASKEKDTEVQVLSVVRNGKPVAVLFNHPTHPLQTGTDTMSVGHCGYALDTLEERIPGCIALYADGCGGNQFARKPRETRDPLDAVKALATSLSDVVSGTLTGTMTDVTGPISTSMETISLPLADPMPREDAEELARRLEVPMDIGYVPYPDENRETNWIRALIRHYDEGLPFPKRTTDMVCTDDGFLLHELPEAREFPCRYEETIVAKIGKLVFVAMQGEVCAPIGMRIKDTFRHEHPIMVFAYMGEHNLYIPTRRIVEMDVYQSKVLRIQYACPVGWSPEVETEMGDAVIAMVNGVLAR